MPVSNLWLLPFALQLLALALLPVVAPPFWASNPRKLLVSALLGLPVVALYLSGDAAALLPAARDYAAFLTLLASLFVIAGGIRIEGDLPATPLVNASFLGAGALLASLVGTTGASLLLIRPLLETNRERRHVSHTVVFFIFLVGNIGGCLTPLGDPPLFLGYLAGVPFTWTLRLWPAWLLATAAVLGVYLLLDARAYARESPEDLLRGRLEVRPLRVAGGGNLALLLGVVVSAVALSSPSRETAMALLALVSLRATPAGLRRANGFGFGPILEVAAVFAGIFSTAVPALEILRARGAVLGLDAPWQFFWATGLVSSLLDNAPTYMAFLALAQGAGLTAEVAGVPERVLAAISLGAVFMGAITYIGNGPNFMVRAIAEESGVRMPGFGRYLLLSGAVLLPVFALVTLVFFG